MSSFVRETIFFLKDGASLMIEKMSCCLGGSFLAFSRRSSFYMRLVVRKVILLFIKFNTEYLIWEVEC